MVVTLSFHSSWRELFVFLSQECLLDFVFHYVQRQNRAALRDSRPGILGLVRECLATGPPLAPFHFAGLPPVGGSTALSSGRKQLSPRSYFLLLLLLADFARKLQNYEDKKEQKEMQDVCVRCIEACNSIVDWSLEHGGWLARRAPTVLPGSSQSDLTGMREKFHAESSSSIDLTGKVLIRLPKPSPSAIRFQSVVFRRAVARPSGVLVLSAAYRRCLPRILAGSANSSVRDGEKICLLFCKQSIGASLLISPIPPPKPDLVTYKLVFTKSEIDWTNPGKSLLQSSVWRYGP